MNLSFLLFVFEIPDWDEKKCFLFFCQFILRSTIFVCDFSWIFLPLIYTIPYGSFVLIFFSVRTFSFLLSNSVHWLCNNLVRNPITLSSNSLMKQSRNKNSNLWRFCLYKILFILKLLCYDKTIILSWYAPATYTNRMCPICLLWNCFVLENTIMCCYVSCFNKHAWYVLNVISLIAYLNDTF